MGLLLGRACFNSPKWGGGSSPVKTEPLQIVPLLLCLLWWLWCRRLRGARVSVQACAYMQLIQRAALAASATSGLRTSQTSSCSDRSLASDSVINQPLREEKGRVANLPHPLGAPNHEGSIFFHRSGVGGSPKCLDRALASCTLACDP